MATWGKIFKILNFCKVRPEAMKQELEPAVNKE